MKKAIGIIVLIIFLYGCASLTTIKTNPEGATISIPEYQSTCTSPCDHSDMKISGSVTNLIITKEGYAPLNATIQKDFPSVADIVLSLVLNPVQFFYWFRYPDSYMFELTEIAEPTVKKVIQSDEVRVEIPEPIIKTVVQPVEIIEKPAGKIIKPHPVDPRYSKIKAIKLVNGKIIEGQIISMNAQVLKIMTKDGEILSFSFIGEVNQLITE